ncbi:hypothetical protein CI238_06864 [Colletotrichum incanum]|uniref:Uncharacterized protein n=1 Tax=Colletotrichum incanum TaxID=1573173 RepID=A0A166ZJY3_COLIC|nr:hypothetical protein CI238_06864 [Colletotrichum incanum]
MSSLSHLDFGFSTATSVLSLIMRFTQLILFILLTTLGLAAPATRKPDDKSFSEDVDPLVVAGKTAPFNPDWNYCQTKCDCAKRFDKSTQREDFFQCITDPNCEQCARNGMSPSKV